MGMCGRSKKQAAMDHAATTKDFAVALARDKKFRKQLLSALGHGAKAKRRARSRAGLAERARDRTSRRRLVAALGQGAKGKRRARSRVGMAAAATRLATGRQLRSGLQ